VFFSRPLTARPATPADRNAVQTLARYEARVHAHLDWKPVEDWLGQQPFLVAERGTRVVAALACPPDLPDTAWLRLFVVAEGVEAQAAWTLLWPRARHDLVGQGLAGVAALSLDAWTEPLYESVGFQRTHDVVVLSRAANRPLSAKPASRRAGMEPALVRAAGADDLAAIGEADRSAFRPPWQLSPEMVRVASAQAEYLSVAEYAGRVIGYQLTTPSRAGAHLARLAVLPELQGRGVATRLVEDLIAFYARRGGREITVNTQSDNQASLAVYQHLGFEFTGARFPVYQLAL
jgi:ribosomal protein S18 acetylase RimI-like enzyme